MTDNKISRRRMLKLIGAGSAGAVMATQLPAVTAKSSIGVPAFLQTRPKLTIWLENNLIAAVDDYNKAIFEEWGAANGYDIEFQAVGNAVLNEQLAAAVEAGTPPDIMQLSVQRLLFWQSRGQLVPVTDVVEANRDNAGGMLPAALDFLYADGEAWGMTYGLDASPMHVRQDLLDAAGLTYPETWEEFAEVAKAIQQPPGIYGWGLPMGNDGDCNISFTPILWGYGGKICNDDGSLAFKSDAMLQAIEFVRKAYVEDRIIPPGAVGWVGVGNNQAYQSRQVAMTYNSLSIYAWAVQNDPELAEATAIYPAPGGPAGRFDGTQGWALSVFSASEHVDAAKDALNYFFEPERYWQFIELGTGRTLPIYRDQLFSDYFLENPIYRNIPDSLMTARSRSYSGPFHAAMSEFENTFVLPTMLQNVTIYGVDPEAAMEEAYQICQEIWERHGY